MSASEQGRGIGAGAGKRESTIASGLNNILNKHWWPENEDEAAQWVYEPLCEVCRQRTFEEDINADGLCPLCARYAADY